MLQSSLSESTPEKSSRIAAPAKESTERTKNDNSTQADTAEASADQFLTALWSQAQVPSGPAPDLPSPQEMVSSNLSATQAAVEAEIVNLPPNQSSQMKLLAQPTSAMPAQGLGVPALDGAPVQLNTEITESPTSWIGMTSALQSTPVLDKSIGSEGMADVRTHVSTPCGQEGWDQAVSQKVSWMVQDQIKSATLTLNPPNMGPIHIQVQLDQQQVHVQFVSVQPEVRQALQQAIPALEAMMTQSGLQLGQSDVSDQRQPAGRERSEQTTARPQMQQSDAADATLAVSPAQLRMGTGLLNTFA
jgi:flagellar hook-length control protein FliK